MATINATGCSSGEVQAAINAANEDDIVQLPPCAATGWNTTVTCDKRITIQGGGVTTGLSNGITVPITCDTNIRDDHVFTSLINWTVPPCTHPCGGDGLASAKLLNICFTNGGNRIGGTVIIYSTKGGTALKDGRQFRAGYLRFTDMGGAFTFWHTVYRGVFDHIYDSMPSGTNRFFIYTTAGGFDLTDGSLQDSIWAEPINFGGDDWFFVEDVDLVKAGTSTFTFSDSIASAAKTVFRKSHFECGRIDNHGSESNWYRSGRGREIYQNSFTACNPGVDQFIVHTRGGSDLVWGNTTTNAFAPTSSVNHYTTYRALGPQSAYNVADGNNKLDINNAGNPVVALRTSTSAGSLTVTDLTASFSNMAGYIVEKTNCTVDAYTTCSGVIISNTATQITFKSGLSGAWPDLSFNAGGGDSFRINRITQVFDQPCVGGNPFGTIKSLTDLTVSGAVATATFTSCVGCFTTGDYVAIQSDYCERSGGGACNGTPGDQRAYSGIHQITNATSTSFQYTPPFTPTGNATGGTNYTKKITTVPISQPTEECGEWLNYNNGSLMTATADPYNDFIRVNEHYYNYTTGSYSSTLGIKSGTTLPVGSCTEGWKFWKTNEGNWDADNPGNSGVMYRCNNANTWVLWYTPYQYPHHLVTGTFPQEPSDPSVPVILMGAQST